MKLRFLVTHPDLCDLRANQSTRQWMDETPEKFAYRCLPLSVANSYGWSLHMTEEISLYWDGKISPEAITIKSSNPEISRQVISTFGSGIVSFHTHGLFQTEAGWSLMASGPANSPKDSIAPLTGIIETDWSPFSFTMNWQFTRPGTWVTFRKGEPFCNLFPVQRGFLETVETEMISIDSEKDLKKQHNDWVQSRRVIIEDLADPNRDPDGDQFQKTYYRGLYPDGSKGPKDHTIKMRVKEFKEIKSDE